MKMNECSKCIGTPVIVDHELAKHGIKATGKRQNDIPKFWGLMDAINPAENSPKATYEKTKRTWMNQGVVINIEKLMEANERIAELEGQLALTELWHKNAVTEIEALKKKSR